MKRKALFLAVPLALGLVACGGGGGTTATSGFVSVMVTDALSTQYTKVWVTITRVTVQDASGATIELFNDPAGQVFNLAELNGISSLLSTQSLATGTYSNLTITLDPAVTLNTSSTTTTATLASTDIVVSGSFTVSGGATSVGIDFDLANFTYDSGTGVVTPTLVLRDHKSMQSLSQAYAELKGTIKSVPTSSLTDFVITIDNGAGATADVTVSLLGNATVFVDSGTYNHNPGVYTDNQVLRDPRFLGQPVEVYGNYDATSLHIDAIRVRAASSSTSDTSLYGDYKLEGLAIGAATGKVTVDVREANFTPPQGSLLVNISNAKFDKGTASDFTNLSQSSPLRVEMRGDWDGSVFTPKIIEIEGAARDRSSGTSTTGVIDNYVEVLGQVQGSLSADGKTFQMSVLSTKHDDTASSSAPISSAAGSTGTIDVNLSQGWFKSGRGACIVDQAYVDIKGSWTDQSVLNAHAIDVKGACSFSNESVRDIQNDANGNDMGLSLHPEAKGKITAVDSANNTLTVEIFQARGVSGVQVGSSITVAYDTTTLFDHGTSANLAADTLIEVNGVKSGWDATSGILTAGKISFL